LLVWPDGLAAVDNTAKQRLSVLLADPSIRLPDLAAELSRLAGGDTVDDNTEKTIMVRDCAQLICTIAQQCN
jgi:hypothetical protein